MQPDGSPSISAGKVKGLIVAMTGIMGFTFNAIGPSMPLIREDLGMGRSLAGLHFTALAAGGLVLGPILERFSRRFGRKRVFWTAAGGLVTGALVIGASPTVAVSLAGALITGLGGAALLITGRSALADSDRAAIGLSMVQNDTSWSFGAIMAGLTVTVLVDRGLGWRPAFVIPAVIAAGLLVMRMRNPFPAGSQGLASSADLSLSVAYWLTWAAFIPAAAGEWSILAWSAGYMVDAQGVSLEHGAFSVTVFLAAMLLGRALGTRLARKFSVTYLLAGGMSIAIAGSAAVWAAPSATGALIALAGTGLGVSLLAPMLISSAVETTTRTDTATARISVAASVAILSAPFGLGVLADQVGIRQAWGVIPLLFVTAAALTTASYRKRPRPAAARE